MQWFVVWPDKSMTDPFDDEEEARTYAMQYPEAWIEESQPEATSAYQAQYAYACGYHD